MSCSGEFESEMFGNLFWRPCSSAGRPGTGFRPGTGSMMAPGTASRLATGQAGNRPGSRAGSGISLSAQVQVTDRLMTQQGLAGMKTAAGGRGPQRQVQDKTYYIGLLRNKINELSTENKKIMAEVDSITEDQSSYVTYEKRAEKRAAEIRDLQAELADYNTLVDKINTGESIADMQMDQEELKSQNDRDAKSLETFFGQKQHLENQIHQLEIELQQERSMTENLVHDMTPDMRVHYKKLTDTNDHLLKELEMRQRDLDELNLKKSELEDELSNSPVKQEAIRLYQQSSELEVKRDQLLSEMQEQNSPQQSRERLLQQVKEDNQEIASMERETNELKDKISKYQDEIRQIEMDIEENSGERSTKYKELKKRDESMSEFLNNFETTKAQEIDRVQTSEQNIVLLLEHISANRSRSHIMPSAKEFGGMKNDLAFKENEMTKSKSTASGLESESDKMAQDLQKIEQLEKKITTEKEMLSKKIAEQNEELKTYGNMDKLKSDAEEKKEKLAKSKVSLEQCKQTFQTRMSQLTTRYESAKLQLSDNETYLQLGNLEKKWQTLEQNNFVMKEYIATKVIETDYKPMFKNVIEKIEVYNQALQDQFHGKK